MENNNGRREFLKMAALSAAGSLAMPLRASDALPRSISQNAEKPEKLKIGLNAYSFDKPLRAGTMTLEDLLEFCAATGFASVDLTGYYFPGYPLPPSDSYLYNLRRKAFRLGIDLGCTGVRNDFTWSDPAKRKEEKKLVKDWITVAAKIGAPGVRIFAGTLSKESFPWDDRSRWIADDIRECAEFGKANGVMLALQNHNDFIKVAADVVKMMSLIGHEWVGMMIDIGSYHTPDPYSDIAATAKYAITWQMKEKVFINDAQVDTDYAKVIDIVRKSGYRGSLPLETLGDGDPFSKVEALYRRVLTALNTP